MRPLAKESDSAQFHSNLDYRIVVRRNSEAGAMIGKRSLVKELMMTCGVGLLVASGIFKDSSASNHFDTAAVVANPQANIGDIYAWTAADGRHLNLVMDIVGRSFSSKLSYVFHIDSGPVFGKTTATTTILCRFPETNIADCRVGNSDRVRGDASGPTGIEGRNRRFRVFAGLRDDPFFNNVRGTRAAYQVAFAALKGGLTRDAAGCPMFDKATAEAILYQWRHTDGGPATNFLAHWTTSALVISVDLDVVDRGGKTLAIWAVTETSARQFDRMGRPLSKNALLGLTDPDGVGDQLKDAWNRAKPAAAGAFVADLEKSLAFYDGLDGLCGNQLLASSSTEPAQRYHALAMVLADDRLWVNAASSQCSQFFAVELANLAGQTALRPDCGGRTPAYNASNVWRSILVNGTVTGVDDGLDHDERMPTAEFPFLGPPDAQAVDH
jgi:hypothetical protein